MKNNYIVVNENREYSLGNYMRMRADQKSEATNLPAVRSKSSGDVIVSSFFKYVNDKLTLKSAPAKDKTIRRFPLRTSLAAMLSAVIACTLIVSYGIVALRGATNSLSATAEIPETVITETEDTEITE